MVVDKLNFPQCCSEDSDFVAGAGAGSTDDDLEFDSDAKISGTDSGEEGEHPEAPQKRKQSSAGRQKAAKRHKQEVRRWQRGAHCRNETILHLFSFWQDDAGDGRGKKKRAKKDPNAPKKPLSGYMIFLQEKRSEIKSKYPGSSVAEVAKKGGEMWNAQKDRTVSDIRKNSPVLFMCLCFCGAEMGGEG